MPRNDTFLGIAQECLLARCFKEKSRDSLCQDNMYNCTCTVREQLELTLEQSKLEIKINFK